MTSWTKEDILSFIELYRSCDCLWRVKSRDYSNRFLREKEYEKLVHFCRVFDPQASKDTVTKKIGNLRTSFKKELKKHELSKLSGAGIDDVYQPKLWYFNNLMFLKDQELPRDVRSNITDRPDVDQASLLDSTHMSMPLSPQASSEVSSLAENQEPGGQTQVLEEAGTSTNPAYPAAQTTRKRRKREAGDDLMQTARERLLKQLTEDEFDVFGKSIAFRLRHLPKEQRVHAQKFISDVLYEAELNQLSRASSFGSTAFKCT